MYTHFIFYCAVLILFLYKMITANTIKTLIIEVSKRSVRFISSTLESASPDFEVVGVTNNLADGLAQIEDLKPNLIFLNFDLAGFNEHKQLDLIFNYKIPVVFLSKYSQHAQYAIKYSPIDYLVYPVSLTDLNQALEKVKKSNRILSN